MKAIKITTANSAAIEAALVSANGRASEHTYSAAGIVRIAQRAEIAVVRLLGAKKHAPGAQMRALSGEAVSNAYSGYTRAATYVVIERKSAAWYLTICERGDVRQGGGFTRLLLTAAQDSLAIAVLHKSYGVISEEASS